MDTSRMRHGDIGRILDRNWTTTCFINHKGGHGKKHYHGKTYQQSIGQDQRVGQKLLNRLHLLLDVRQVGQIVTDLLWKHLLQDGFHGRLNHLDTSPLADEFCLTLLEKNLVTSSFDQCTCSLLVFFKLDAFLDGASKPWQTWMYRWLHFLMSERHRTFYRNHSYVN